MPPFRLELPDKRVKNNLPVRILYSKGSYNPVVKITDWNSYLESVPIDQDPYCPGSLNYLLSHYKRLGTEPNEVPLTTTTQLEQIWTKDNLPSTSTNKYLINYFTYKDTLACEKDSPVDVCHNVCADEFLSTMHYSYRPPHPYVMRRFAIPTTPFLQNRKLKWDTPDTSSNKFYDEDYKKKVSSLQNVKCFRSKSYDPSRGVNSDGCPIKEQRQKCFRLEY